MEKNNAEGINKGQPGTGLSEKQDKILDTDRNYSSQGKKTGRLRHDERNFNLLVDGVPYTVKSIPFLFNDELRFRIILNESSEHVFTRDAQIGMLRAINDDSSVLPAGLEEALSEKLQSQLK